MHKHYKYIVDTILNKNIDDWACHSENLIEPAIRNGELCEIGCPESAIYYRIDSVQTGSHATFLSRFALFYGMTGWVLVDNNNSFIIKNGD